MGLLKSWTEISQALSAGGGAEAREFLDDFLDASQPLRLVYVRRLLYRAFISTWASKIRELHWDLKGLMQQSLERRLTG